LPSVPARFAAPTVPTAAFDAPLFLSPSPFQHDVAQHEVLGLARDRTLSERPDAPILEADGIGRCERQRGAGGTRRAGGAHLDASRIELAHEERSAEGRRERRLHLDVLDAHVEVRTIDHDQLYAQRAPEAACDALDLRALAECAGQAIEHELRAARSADDPVAHAYDRDHGHEGDDEEPAQDPFHHQKAIVTEKARRNLRSRSA
jgi:hypothetical protein